MRRCAIYPAGQIALWSIALFAGAQVGYAVGVGLLAMRTIRRQAARGPTGPEQASSARTQSPVEVVQCCDAASMMRRPGRNSLAVWQRLDANARLLRLSLLIR